MSFDFVGYETLPVDLIKSAMVPVGFAASVAGVVAGPGEEGYYVYPEPGFPKDALVEWPAPQQVRTFYFARWRLCNDPKVREKIEKADQEVHRRNHDRLRITEALRAKRSEKGSIISQVKSLEDEDVLLAKILEKKEPNNLRESGLCSSELELNDLLSSIHYRISNCSLSEQRRLSREIKRLEVTREKVRSHAAIRAWVLEMSPEYTTQGQVNLPEEALEEVRKKQEAVREHIKLLNGAVEIVDGEMKALEEDLAAVTLKRDRAYTRIQELRKQRDDSNGFYYRNRAVLKDAMELAATNDVATLEEVAKFETESFFSLWNSDRSFRENYMRRIRPSLDLRQLDRDGRRKGLEMMRPSAAEEVRVKPGTEKSRQKKDEVKGVIFKEVASPKVTLGNGDDLASGKISGSGIVPSSVLKNDDQLASGKNSSSGVVPSSVSRNVDDLASGKDTISVLPSGVSEKADDLASGKDIISVVPSSVSENDDELANGKNSSSVVVPSSVSEDGYDLASGKDMISVVASSVSEKGDDLAGGENNSIEIVPIILSENADGSGSGKNSSIEIVPSILSENADDLVSGENCSFEIVPSIVSENADGLASEKSCSFGTVPSILTENADGLASEKNISLEIAPEILSENGGDDSDSEKNSSCVTVVNGLSGESDEAEDVKLKLKELKREEEIEKAKKAMERKKKLAEKNALKAAIKAQKEAEKKLKEQEKKARKKVTGPAASPEQAEDEKADENAGTLTRVKQGIYNRRDKFWRRQKSKDSDAVLKAILKRRRSANYWFWAVTIALFLAVFTVLGYCFFLQKL